MAIAAEALARDCPSCGAAMRREAFARRGAGTLQVEICFPCRGLWLDPYEGAQFAPEGVIGLFRAIADAQQAEQRPLATVMHCVACRTPLQLTHDVERASPFVYYRCPAGHGRFTPFVQFLREKRFVRSLTPVEVERLRATVAQVRCSSCGAPIDLAHDPQCPYCGAPIAILDPDAVHAELAALVAEEKAAAPHPRIEEIAAAAFLQPTIRAEHQGLIDLLDAGVGRLLATFQETR